MSTVLEGSSHFSFVETRVRFFLSVRLLARQSRVTVLNDFSFVVNTFTSGHSLPAFKYSHRCVLGPHLKQKPRKRLTPIMSRLDRATNAL